MPCARKLAVKNWIFQHDNAPIHVSNESKKWLSDHIIDVIDWPPYSLALNPIENLWGIVSRKVYADGKQYKNKTLNELKNSIFDGWNKVESDNLHSLVDSMPSQIYELISKQGLKIDY